jgi:hypothetical protein
VSSVTEIENVTTTIQNVGDQITLNGFMIAENMCTDVGAVPSLPRICGKQIHRSNIPADSPSEYFRSTISIPLLDHLLSEMSSQFGNHQQTVLLGLYLALSIMVSLSWVL